MTDNYLVLNGKRIDLTDEQLEKLGLEKERNNPFEIYDGEQYFFIGSTGSIQGVGWYSEAGDFKLYDVANACKDIKLIKQRTMHETLDRLLWRFSCENGELENPWDYKSQHWYFYKQKTMNGEEFKFCYKTSTKELQVSYFPTEELARQAVDEIVLPFMQKHPDFVW